MNKKLKSIIEGNNKFYSKGRYKGQREGLYLALGMGIILIIIVAVL